MESTSTSNWLHAEIIIKFMNSYHFFKINCYKMAYKNIIRLHYDSMYPFNNKSNIYKVFCLLDAMLSALYMLFLENLMEETEAGRL